MDRSSNPRSHSTWSEIPGKEPCQWQPGDALCSAWDRKIRRSRQRHRRSYPRWRTWFQVLKMDNLVSLLPDYIRRAAVPCNAELAYPPHLVHEVLKFATQKEVAVLGVEAVEIQPGGILVKSCSTYECRFAGDWASFVQENNVHADDFIERNPQGEEHAYLLTTASSSEFDQLRK